MSLLDLTNRVLNGPVVDEGDWSESSHTYMTDLYNPDEVDVFVEKLVRTDSPWLDGNLEQSVSEDCLNPREAVAFAENYIEGEESYVEGISIEEVEGEFEYRSRGESNRLEIITENKTFEYEHNGVHCTRLYKVGFDF